MATEGLWHATDDKAGDTSFFLIYRGEDSRVFNADWIEIDSKFKLEEEGFRFEAPYKAWGMKIWGNLCEGKMQGKWHTPHPQFRVEGAWSAECIFEAGNWDPWAFLQPNKQIIDLVEAVRQGMPFEDYPAFLSHWKKVIEPRFFALLTHTVYSQGGRRYQPRLRETRPKEIYDLFRVKHGLLLKRNKNLADAIPNAMALLKEQYPWLKPEIPVCSLFSFGAFDFKYQKVGRNPFLLFGTDWISQSLTEEETKRLAAEGLVYSRHCSILGPSTQVGREILYRGVAALLLEDVDALRLSVTESESAPANLASLKKRLGKRLRRSSNWFFSTFLKERKRSRTYQLCLEFARFVSAGKEPWELFQLKREDRRKALDGFFTPQGAEVEKSQNGTE
jgi:hypothetical protein